jgi:hypothetical protein
MRGQVFEIMGFVVLAIAIIAVIILLRTTAIGSFGKTILTLAERQESEGVRAGVNAFFSMTESKSGKTIQELVGVAAYVGNDTVDMGPAVGDVNVPNEVTWRMNALFGQGHWHMTVGYPNIIPDIQIVMVLDTSSSMCYSIPDISKKLPQIIDQLRAAGKRVSITIYMLPGSVKCCGASNGFTLTCDSSEFPEKSYFHCKTIESIQNDCQAKLPLGNDPQTGSAWQTSEDYGDGLACAIEVGPAEGWAQHSIKLAIGSSDEMSIGSECDAQNHCCPSVSSYPSAIQSGNRAIEASLKNGIPLYLIQVIDYVDQARTQCGSICFIENDPSYQNPQYCSGNQCTYPLGDPQCKCTDVVSQFQQNLASKTGGQYYTLNDITAKDMAAKIQDIINHLQVNRKKSLEAGSPIPIEKNIRAVNFPIPVAVAGIYTLANITEWS